MSALVFDGYGYPVELVATWCGVSLRTAAAWKAGVSKPSGQALALFELHREGRVLSCEDWAGWSVHRGELVDPDGVHTTQSQLRAYGLVIPWAREAARLLSQTGAGRVCEVLGIAAPAMIGELNGR